MPTPLLGPIDLTQCIDISIRVGQQIETPAVDGLRRWLGWVICGGESGPGARPMETAWARGLRDQCVEAGVPFFFKQWGDYYAHTYGRSCAWHPDGWNPAEKHGGHILDGREWKEFPR